MNEKVASINIIVGADTVYTDKIPKIHLASPNTIENPNSKPHKLYEIKKIGG